MIKGSEQDYHGNENGTNPAERVSLAYTVESDKRFDQLVSEMANKTVGKGFKVLFIHDV